MQEEDTYIMQLLLCGMRMSCMKAKKQRIRDELNFAVRHGDTVAVQQIIQRTGRELDINKPDEEGELPLHLAVKGRDIETTTMLLSCGANVNKLNSVSSPLSELQHPLALAAAVGDISLVKLLLDRGSCPNAQMQFCRINCDASSSIMTDKSALHYAVEHLEIDIVKILLKHGAETDTVDCYSDTPLHYAVVCYRRWEDSHRSERHYAAGTSGRQRCQTREEILQLLLSSAYTSSSILNAVNENGLSALYIAAQHGCNNSVKMLLNAGANPNILGNDRFGIPLHIAVCNDDFDVVRTLVTTGSNLNLRNGYDLTPLTLALRFDGSKTNVITTLIIHGSRLHATKYSSDTLVGLCLRTMRQDCNMICPLLVYAGCKLKKETWQRPFEEHFDKETELCDWLREMRSNPHTLKSMCRIAIRNYINDKVLNGKSIVGRTMALPVPRYMKEYLLLKDVVNIGIKLDDY